MILKILKYLSFLLVYFWCLCQESSGCTWIDLFLGPQLHAIIQLISVSVVPAQADFYYYDSGV